jgi:hypothetical protein
MTALLARLASLLPRRRHGRQAANLAVEWRQFGDAVVHRSSLGDLSPGGAFMRAVCPREVGAPVVLDLPTASGTRNIHARVAWRSTHGMGLRFTRPLESPT